MKYYSASTLALLAALHQCHALTRPGQASLLAIPQEQKEQLHQLDDSSSSFGLLVDGEGNLYSPASSSDRQTVVPRTSSLTNMLSALRGGHLAVDSEGCFYTPRLELLSSKNTRDVADASPSSPAISACPTESIRGGSKNNRFGGLCVDAEGNFYAAGAAASPSSAGTLESLRGGALSVDNEGNFYTPHAPALPKEPEPTVYLPQTLASNRRGRNHKSDESDMAGPASTPDQGRILLAKNKLRRKRATEDKPKESPPQPTNSFIGFNNALMET